MPVVREGPRDAQPPHHGERDLIDDPRPAGFALAIGGTGGVPVVVGGEDEAARLFELVEQSADRPAIRPSSGGVAALGQNE